MPITVESLYELPLLAEVRLSPSGRTAAAVHVRADREADDYLREIRLHAVEPGACLPPGSAVAGDLPRWAPDGSELLLRRSEPVPGIWRWCPGASEAGFLVEMHRVLDLEWSPSGTEIAVLMRRDPQTAPIVVGVPQPAGELLVLRRDSLRLSPVQAGVAAFAWRPDGSAIAVASDATPARPPVLSIHSRDGGPARQVDHGLATIESVAWLPDGSALVLAGKAVRDSAAHVTLHILELGTGRRRRLAALLDRNVMVGAPGYPGAAPQPTPDGRSVVFAARERGAVHLLRAPLDDGAPAPLVAGADHVVSAVSAAGDQVVAVVARADTPGDLCVLRLDGRGGLRWLTGSGAAAVAGASRPQEFVVEGADGYPVHGWLLRPAAPLPGPLLLDIHGGPHNAFAPAFSDIYLYRHELLARGWSVAFCNPRGSDGYGEAGRRALHGGWGTADEGDFLAVIDALVDRGVADPAQIAVTGYSYGGYMAQWLTARTGRFTAAVVGGGISDLASCHASSDEAELLVSELGGPPLELPDRYRELSPLQHAAGVTAPTLLLHGLADRSCPPGQAEAWLAALRQRRVPCELVLYPGAGHLFIVDGRPSHRVDYGRRLVRWITEHAPPVPARATDD